jgi:hypothetical protein
MGSQLLPEDVFQNQHADSCENRTLPGKYSCHPLAVQFRITLTVILAVILTYFDRLFPNCYEFVHFCPI